VTEGADPSDAAPPTDEPVDQFLYLTTVGRKSGLPRQIEIWYVALNGCYYLVSELRERAQWVQNLRAEPRVGVRLGRWTGAGVGRVVDPAAEPELAASVTARFDEKYGWSDGLIVEITPSVGPLNDTTNAPRQSSR
jgi:deazaflavin-dependent oxidoreductase (nitroreductase family)